MLVFQLIALKIFVCISAQSPWLLAKAIVQQCTFWIKASSLGWSVSWHTWGIVMCGSLSRQAWPRVTRDVCWFGFSSVVVCLVALKHQLNTVWGLWLQALCREGLLFGSLRGGLARFRLILSQSSGCCGRERGRKRVTDYEMKIEIRGSFSHGNWVLAASTDMRPNDVVEK